MTTLTSYHFTQLTDGLTLISILGLLSLPFPLILLQTLINSFSASLTIAKCLVQQNGKRVCLFLCLEHWLKELILDRTAVLFVATRVVADAHVKRSVQMPGNRAAHQRVGRFKRSKNSGKKARGLTQLTPTVMTDTACATASATRCTRTQKRREFGLELLTDTDADSRRVRMERERENARGSQQQEQQQVTAAAAATHAPVIHSRLLYFLEIVAPLSHRDIMPVRV